MNEQYEWFKRKRVNFETPHLFFTDFDGASRCMFCNDSFFQTRIKTTDGYVLCLPEISQLRHE